MRQLSSIVILETSFHLFRELLDIGTMNNIYIYVIILYIPPQQWYPSFRAPSTHPTPSVAVATSSSSLEGPPRQVDRGLRIPDKNHIAGEDNGLNMGWWSYGILNDIKWTYPWNLTCGYQPTLTSLQIESASDISPCTTTRKVGFLKYTAADIKIDISIKFQLCFVFGFVWTFCERTKNAILRVRAMITVTTVFYEELL